MAMSVQKEKESAGDNRVRKKSFLDTVREIDERERNEELEREAEAASLRAAKERAAREEYGRRLDRERVELLKLKAGVAPENAPAEDAAERVYTKKEKISNFFYHHKPHMAVFAFFAAVTAFLIYDMASRVEPDVTIMFIATDARFSQLTAAAEEVFERYCEDFNGDGRVSVRVNYLPALDFDNPDYNFVQATQIRLMSEFQSGDTIIVIADEETVTEMGVGEGVFADLGEIYPGDPAVVKYGYMLNATTFKTDVGEPELSDDLFAAFRLPTGDGASGKKFAANFNNALTLWNNYINRLTVNS
jgi:hypothetical protein